MISIQEKIDHLKSNMSAYNTWEERYQYIIKMGKEMPLFPEEFRLETNKVKGCQSQVWLHAYYKDGQVHYAGDSDASIVKGLVALLLFVYNEQRPEDILAVRPNFLEELGLRQHLSMSRSNGLTAMIKQIIIYAMAFKTKDSR